MTYSHIAPLCGLLTLAHRSRKGEGRRGRREKGKGWEGGVRGRGEGRAGRRGKRRRVWEGKLWESRREDEGRTVKGEEKEEGKGRGEINGEQSG